MEVVGEKGQMVSAGSSNIKAEARRRRDSGATSTDGGDLAGDGRVFETLASPRCLFPLELCHPVIGSIWWTASRVIHQAPEAHSPEPKRVTVGRRELRE